MIENLKFWTVFALIVAVIIAVGWNQPLRYRFMSAEEIYAIEHPEPPAELQPEWMRTQIKRSRLEEPAKPVSGGVRARGTGASNGGF